MKGKKCFWMFIGIGMLLMGLLTGCGPSRSFAVDSSLETPSAGDMTHTADEKVVFAIDLGWGNSQIAPLPFRGVGLGEPRRIVPTTQDQDPIVSLVSIGITGDLLVANALFTPPPRTVEEVPWVLEHARGGLVTVDLMSGQVRMLRENVGGHSTDGHHIVWSQRDYGEYYCTGELHVYDLQTDRTFPVDTGALCPSRPDIADGIVMWDINRGYEASLDIYGYNLVTEHGFTVTNRSGCQKFAQTDGVWVAYLEVEKGPAREIVSRQLYAYRLETDKEFQLGEVWHMDESVEYTYHAIDAGRVAWVTPDEQIYIYDLSTHQEQVLTELPSNCGRPADLMLSGDILVFGCYNQLVGYDLGRDVLFSIPLLPPGDWESTLGGGLVLSGDRLVWSYTLNGEQRVYTAQIVRE